jgi:hypothetical protein
MLISYCTEIWANNQSTPGSDWQNFASFSALLSRGKYQLCNARWDGHILTSFNYTAD